MTVRGAALLEQRERELASWPDTRVVIQITGYPGFGTVHVNGSELRGLYTLEEAGQLADGLGVPLERR